VIRPAGYTDEPTLGLVERLGQGAAVGAMSSCTDFSLRYVLACPSLLCRGQQIEQLRVLAMAQDAEA
jgi:hypothetical protein